MLLIVTGMGAKDNDVQKVAAACNSPLFRLQGPGTMFETKKCILTPTQQILRCFNDASTKSRDKRMAVRLSVGRLG